MDKRILLREKTMQRGGLGLRLAFSDFPAGLVDHMGPAAERDDVGMGVKKRKLRPQAIRRTNIVAIHPDDDLRARKRNPMVQSMGDAKMFLARAPDAGIAADGFRDDAFAPVLRAVIHDD